MLSSGKRLISHPFLEPYFTVILQKGLGFLGVFQEDYNLIMLIRPCPAIFETSFWMETSASVGNLFLCSITFTVFFHV